MDQISGLKQLFYFTNAKSEQNYDSRAYPKEIYELEGPCHWMRREDIEELLKANDCINTRDQIILLPALPDVDKDWIAVLQIEWDITSSDNHNQQTVRLSLIKRDRNNGWHISSFHFDSPNTDLFNFPHVHLCRKPVTPLDRLKHCTQERGIPNALPRICIPAKNVIALVFCALHALYGTSFLERCPSDLKQFMKHLINPDWGPVG